jgi:FlaA1/EpsC-like NDP-sugar epimerase
LAEQLIRFHGYEPYQDIPISVIGLRKGEKLTESLTESYEGIHQTEFPKIFEVSQSLDWTNQELSQLLEELYPVCYLDPHRSSHFRDRKLLRRILASRLSALQENTDEPQF